MTENEVLDYVDLLATLAGTIEQFGARRISKDFRDFYPELFEELLIQALRVQKERQIAALLKPLNNANSKIN